MSNYFDQDLRFTADGDLAVDNTGELKLAAGNELIEQITTLVVKVTNPDWAGNGLSVTEEYIGADLEDFLGYPNSLETKEAVQARIQGSLLKTGFYETDDIFVEAKPLDDNTILFMVMVNSPFQDKPLVFRVDLSLGNGATIRRFA